MLTDNQWFTERIFWHTEFFPKHKLWFRKNVCSTWFFLEYPPIRSAIARCWQITEGLLNFCFKISYFENFYHINYHIRRPSNPSTIRHSNIRYPVSPKNVARTLAKTSKLLNFPLVDGFFFEKTKTTPSIKGSPFGYIEF